MTFHAPTPAVLARNLRQLADRLDDEGQKAMSRAHVYAGRGFPAGTLGTGPHSTTPTSSTETAALNPSPLDGLDERLRATMTSLSAGCIILHGIIDRVMVHASDDDPIPLGQGVCDRCGLVCKRNGQRIHRNQLCHACNEAYRRGQAKGKWSTKSEYLTATAGAAAYDNVRRRLTAGA